MRFDWHRFDNIYTKLEKKHLLDEFLNLLFTPEEQHIFNQRLRIIEALLEGKTDVMAGVVNNKVAYTTLHDAITKKATLDTELLRISKILST